MINSSTLDKYRDDFQVLSRNIDGNPVIYLDSAATSLKPDSVIKAVTDYYTQYTANVHRATHALSEEATQRFEAARDTIASFINADSREIAFTHNATAAINAVAATLVKRGRVALSLSEHHSNMLPWRKGEIIDLPLAKNGELDVEASVATILNEQPSLVSLSTISNALGVCTPLNEIIAAARQVGAEILLDLSQSVGHEPVDVNELDCDYACFSGHKMLGPGGVGVLYCREGGDTVLEPVNFGGAMVHQAHISDHELRPFPWSMEAGTPNAEGILGLAAAADYLETVGQDRIEAHCRNLIARAYDGICNIPKVVIHTPNRGALTSILSFSIAGMDAHGISRILSNRYGIMARSGFHCAQPLHEYCELPETVRISVHLYNNQQDIEQFVQAIQEIAKMA